MNSEACITVLNRILSRTDGCVVLIKGEWGVGKTYFWNENVRKIVGKKKSAYVSLFGKSSLESIQSDALIQIFPRNKVINVVNGFLTGVKTQASAGDFVGGLTFGIGGNVLTSLLSLAKANELGECVLCLDDFERKSDSLKIKEILGFASVLSERYGCKVVLIMDEDKISDDEREVYCKYKEKVVFCSVELVPDLNKIINSIICKIDKRYHKGVEGGLSVLGEKIFELS